MNIPLMRKYRKLYKQGEVLLREGETGQEFYLLEKGSLDVLIQGRIVGFISAHSGQDFFGEVGAILGMPRTATVVAATDCVAMCLPNIDLEAILKSSPVLGVRLMRSLCKKLVKSASALSEFQIESTSILRSENTEASLKNYMRGVLHLMETAAEENSIDTARQLLEYFRETNPWSIEHGDAGNILSDLDTEPTSKPQQPKDEETSPK